MNIKGQKSRGNGQGCAIRIKTNCWKAIVVVGYRNGDPTKPIRRTKSGFKTKSEALEYIPILKGEKRAEIATLASLYEVYSTSAMKKLSSSQQAKLGYAKKRLEPIFAVDLKRLTIKDLQTTVDDATRSYYPARDMKVLLSHLYDRACAEGYVLSNLAKYISLPTLHESEQKPFSEDDIRIFWEKFSDGDLFAGYILLMIYTGMMPGELMACTIDMINFEDQTIVGCGKKTKKRQETPIIIADAILPVVEALVENSANNKLLPYDKTSFYEVYADKIKEYGVSKLPPYSCRHTTATALANLNTSAPIIKEIMRHSQIQTTTRYIHMNTAQMIKAVNKISTGPKKK